MAVTAAACTGVPADDRQPTGADEAGSTTGDAPMKHEAGPGGHHDHSTTIETSGWDTVPSVSIEAIADPGGGWNIRAELEGLRLAPENVSTAHVDGEGHMHIYVNGEKIARMYGLWHHLGNLEPGTHEVRIDLSSNDHSTLVLDGEPISATTTIEEAGGDGTAAGPREGEVHIHEDGFVHTHGAGAPEEWIVTYTEDGKFVPERLEIVTGDTVTWVNESSYGVWPASNIHPSHEIYPEFDPLGDIPPGESWSFTFTRNGTWRYHNHSYASETGVITSSGGPETALGPLDINVAAPEFPDPPADFDPVPLLYDLDALELYVSMYGPDAAVQAVRQAGALEGILCHDVAHQIGRVTYQLFGAAGFQITPHECDSGAIHGVLEALFAERGTATLAEDLTIVCGDSLGTDDVNWYRINKCVHGIGHGLMAWTGYELHEALELCDIPDFAQNACYSGVYMENGVAGRTGITGHTSEYISIVDPHYPCNEVAQRYVADCYAWQPSNLLLHFELSVEEIRVFCEDLLGKIRTSCIFSWSSSAAGALFDNVDDVVALCEDEVVTDRDRESCVSGISRSWVGDIDLAINAARFCDGVDASEVLSDDLGDLCWSGVFDSVRQSLQEHHVRNSFCGAISGEERALECASILLGIEQPAEQTTP